MDLPVLYFVVIWSFTIACAGVNAEFVEVLGQLLAEKSQYDVVCRNFERPLPIWLVDSAP